VNGSQAVVPPQPHPRCLPRRHHRRRRGSSMRHLLTDIWTPSPGARSKSARCSSAILRLSAQHGHWRHGRSLRRHRGSRTSPSRTWAKGHLAASQLRETRGRSLHSSLAARRLTRKHTLRNPRRVQRLQRPKRQCWRHSSRRDIRHSWRSPSPSVCPRTCHHRVCATRSCRWCTSPIAAAWPKCQDRRSKRRSCTCASRQSRSSSSGTQRCQSA